ncbi:MAG: semialdehyde dehydrogenase [Bacteroidetes bacterium]|nr:MAG: semialdehyde dehydrogenase [Bacteroidota bacterium]
MKAIVLGATGMVGSELVRQLISEEQFHYIDILSRRPLEIQNPKLSVKLVKFDDMNSYRSAIDKADTIFCCIGTTMKNVRGNKVLYRKIDYDIAMDAAKFGLEKGVGQYVLVSAVGANPMSGNFYLRLKGEVEDAIHGLPFESTYIMRPSMLFGKREEFRWGEVISKPIIQVASAVLSGSLRKYKPIDAKDVARAMIGAAQERLAGFHICEYGEMMRLTVPANVAR